VKVFSVAEEPPGVEFFFKVGLSGKKFKGGNDELLESSHHLSLPNTSSWNEHPA
jgi:hypothetical protein